MNAKAILNGALIVFIGTFLSSIIGLLREVLSASYFGASAEMDAYLFATAVPFIILAFVDGFLKAGFIPAYIKKRVNGSLDEVSNLFSNMLNVLLLFIIFIMALCYVFTYQMAQFFSDNQTTVMLIQNMIWILLPSILFMGFSYILSAILNSINHFTVPAFLPVINNVIVILLVIFLHHSLGIYSVAIGFITGAFLQVILQIPAIKKSGIQYKLRINFMDKDLRKILFMSFPIIGLVLIDQCGFLATRYFSSSLDPGSASALNYASRIISLPITLFGTALVTAVYPSAILMHEEKQFDKYDHIVKTGLKSMLLIFIPTTFICVIYAPNIIRILFERGAFDSVATNMTAICLIFLAITIILSPIKEFIVKLFYSKSIIKVPLFSTVFSLITFISSCVLLVPRFKYIGIAIASSLSLLISLTYLIIKYNAMDPKRKIRINFGYITKVILASGLSSGFSFLFYWICLEYGEAQKSWLIITLLSIGINVVVYLMLVKIFKIKEIDFVLTAILAKFKIRRKVLINES